MGRENKNSLLNSVKLYVGKDVYIRLKSTEFISRFAYDDLDFYLIFIFIIVPMS